MQIAFIMPSDAQRQQIGTARERIAALRPNQLVHFEHLLRSWRIFSSYEGIALVYRALKRTLNDRP